MAKKKTIKDAWVKVDFYMPIPVARFCDRIAKLTGLTQSDVINVMMAIECERRAQGKPREPK